MKPYLSERRDAEYSGKPDIRERIKRSGTAAMADYELLAAVLGTGAGGKDVRSLAKDVLESIDGSAGVPEPDALCGIRGLGGARACRVSAALELGRRFYGHRGNRISSPADAWQLVRHFDDRKQERFLACLLNGANDVMDVRVVTVGLINRTIVHPREIFAEAIALRSCALIVAHNHPSGRLEPSQEDREMTDRLYQAGELLGIHLLDHIIFSNEGYVSMVETGLLPARRQ